MLPTPKQFTRNTVGVGQYRYFLPNWKSSVIVNVVSIDEKLIVQFAQGMVGVDVEDIPAFAIFEELA